MSLATATIPSDPAELRAFAASLQAEYGAPKQEGEARSDAQTSASQPAKAHGSKHSKTTAHSSMQKHSRLKIRDDNGGSPRHEE
jgi:hypothetical protein